MNKNKYNINFMEFDFAKSEDKKNYNNINSIIKKIVDVSHFFTFGLVWLTVLFLLVNTAGGEFSWDLGFIDPSSAFAESLIRLYNLLWFVLIIVLILVLMLLIRIIYIFVWQALYMESKSSNVILDFFFLIVLSFFVFIQDKHLIYTCLDRYSNLRNSRTALTLNLFNSDAPNISHLMECFQKVSIHNVILKYDNLPLSFDYLIYYYKELCAMKKEHYKLIHEVELDDIIEGGKKTSHLYLSDLVEYKELELAWSVLPAGVLMSLVSPTFSLIFSLDSSTDPAFTIKVDGNQWYWTYEYDVIVDETNKKWRNLDMDWEGLKNSLDAIFNANDQNFLPWRPSKEDIIKYSRAWMLIEEEILYSNYVTDYSFSFDSVMKSDEDLLEGSHRLWEVDERVVLPVGVPIRFIITSSDVLHSWAVPSLGIKVDAVPGRLNQFIVEIKKPGIFYGQCSELCGPLHGYMPIVVEAISVKDFESWLYFKWKEINHK